MPTITLGPVPAEESCAQVGDPDYGIKAHAECRAWRQQLIRFAKHSGKTPPETVKLIITSNAHDYGTYHEVGAKFEIGDDAAEAFAYWLQDSAPGEWDADARVELGLTVDL